MALINNTPTNTSSDTAVEKKKTNGTEYQRKAKAAKYAAAMTLAAVIKRSNVQLSEDEKKALELLTRAPGVRTGGSAFGEPIIYKIFGPDPKVGQKVTGEEIYRKTRKGYPEMRKEIRTWEAKRGTVVKWDENNNTYEIVELGTLPAKA